MLHKLRLEDVPTSTSFALLLILLLLCFLLPYFSRLTQSLLKPSSPFHTASYSAQDRGVVVSCMIPDKKDRDQLKFLEHLIPTAGVPIHFGIPFSEQNHIFSNLCKKFSSQFPSLFSCFNFKIKTPGYGFAKIFAILQAPSHLKDIIWIDCDTFVIQSLEPLFHELEYLKYGATFWPDLYSSYDPQWKFLQENEAIQFYNSQGKYAASFDSSLLVINRIKSQKALNFLETHIHSPQFQKISAGDKDLWHYSWLATKTEYSIPKFISGIYKKKVPIIGRGTWLKDKMVTQVKVNAKNEPILFHQCLWRCQAHWLCQRPTVYNSSWFDPPSRSLVQHELQMKCIETDDFLSFKLQKWRQVSDDPQRWNNILSKTPILRAYDN